MRQTSFNRLGPYLKPAMQAACSKKTAVFAQLFGLWPELMRQSAANGTSPAKLTYPAGRDQPALLYVATQSAGLAMELNYQAPNLVAQINQLMGFQAIQGVKFFAQPQAMATATKPTKNPAPTPITPQAIDSEHMAHLPPHLPEGLKRALGDLSWHMAAIRAKNT